MVCYQLSKSRTESRHVARIRAIRETCLLLDGIQRLRWRPRYNASGRRRNRISASNDSRGIEERTQDWLQKERLILVGHSWGSILGLSIAKARPDLFYAFVGTGQVGDSTRNYAVAYEALLTKARALKERTAVDELLAIGPPPYPDFRGWSVQRK